MTCLTTLVLLVMVNYSSTYWIIWRSSPQTNLGHDIEAPPQSGDCSGQLTKVECRALYTRQTLDEFDSKFFPFADKKCTLTGGLYCVAASSIPCPADFEIRYFCSDQSGMLSKMCSR
ncbi:uncharacterized protein LOC110978716 isoform X2 [Acanthaster planci]|uniref:Uncharacterized protein LOC110978716 isoform X1 n=1 Tax=Acanthaster planci TaxID=133434 RepID=A0A8B7Y8R8_ACAPL|nr:uncharacterized protein LOC110978716 isoform X1 [Acanthaster planci]XP_022089624.1 uncharacterized protein LOC110978716 isoform X2 [Acanthaster planci]